MSLNLSSFAKLSKLQSTIEEILKYADSERCTPLIKQLMEENPGIAKSVLEMKPEFAANTLSNFFPKLARRPNLKRDIELVQERLKQIKEKE